MRVALLAIVLAGCNELLALRETAVDSDGDLVPDDRDNCPTTANPDQLDSDGEDEGGDACAICNRPLFIDLDGDGYDDGCDLCLGPGPSGVDVDRDGLDDGCDPCVAGVSRTLEDYNRNGIGDGCEVCVPVATVTKDDDGDGLDDSCDRCLLGPPHDEDRDGIDDACDLCPADASADDDATRATEKVGAACKPSDRPANRLVFDPFLRRVDAYWRGLTGQWSYGQDVARATGPSTSRTLRASFVQEFQFSTRIRLLESTAEVALNVQEEILPQLLAANGVACIVRAGVLVLESRNVPLGSAALDTSGPVKLRMTMVQAAPLEFSCEAMTSTTTVSVSRPFSGAALASYAIVGSGTYEIGYAELVGL